MATVEQDITLGRIVGTPVERKEDLALLTGQAKFVDDMSLPGMVWMAVVRSPYAHAGITSVDVTPALAHRGIIAAFSGDVVLRHRSLNQSICSSSAPGTNLDVNTWRKAGLSCPHLSRARSMIARYTLEASASPRCQTPRA